MEKHAGGDLTLDYASVFAATKYPLKTSFLTSFELSSSEKTKSLPFYKTAPVQFAF